MWKNDPFKAKWTIIAKAYSCIRDIIGKQKASLVTFMTLVCPRIGTINVDNYFGKMNWNLETIAGGTKVLKQTSFPDLSYFRADILYTNMTPNEIIQFWAQVGYIPQQVADQIAGEDHFNLVGSSPRNQRPQQSLLASCPVAPSPTNHSVCLGKEPSAAHQRPPQR
jgi:hypothetical protein